MALFRRKKHDASTDPDVPDTTDPTTGSEAEAEHDDVAADDARPSGTELGGTGRKVRANGPHDESEVDGLGGRLDLGALWLPGLDGLELRLEIDEASGNVTGVTAVMADSSLALHAYAAPRTLGIWDDIRDEIAASVETNGGTARVEDGLFGTELAVELPAQDAAGRRVLQPGRFLGVDGPRWFVRGFLAGPAATDAEVAAPLLSLLADAVVVRGADAMAPRELLPLRIPQQAVAQDGVDPTDPVDDLQPFERGPEITEIR